MEECLGLRRRSENADNRDVVVHFDTMSASIYPIRNAVFIPLENDPFRWREYRPGEDKTIVARQELPGMLVSGK